MRTRSFSMSSFVAISPNCLVAPSVSLFAMSRFQSTVPGGSIVVGVLYPPAWYGDADGFAREVAELEQLDPRIQVVVETYEEPHELRTARGKPGAVVPVKRAPPLTDAQRAAFAQLHVALALDLPFDVRAVAPNLEWVQAVGAG